MELEEDPTVPVRTSTKYSEVRSSMQTVFDDSLVLSFREVVEESVMEIFNGKGMAAFQKSLRNGVNRICCTVQQRVMELIDKELVRDQSLRKGWVVERRNDPKSIVSPFGEVKYERTYFQNKKTGQYAYLADKLVGYTPHQRLDTLLEADVLEEAVDKSYRKAGKSVEKQAQGTGVSGQTVLNIVRKLQPETIEFKEKPEVKRTARVLYIEADEDHVAHQEKGSRAFEQRLVYVHEGRIRVAKDRYKLVGKKYFTFPSGTKSETMWMTIWHYLVDTYDLEETEHILISGDGAPWIKAGVEYIPDSHYVLDGFHLRKAISKAAGADEENRKALSEAIFGGKWTEMNRLLILFREEAEKEARKEAILETQGYLNKQWSGIQTRRKYADILVGCSAEGHVSHILSARLSSRPMGWSYLGADQMAHLRVHRENGVNVSQLHIEQSSKEKKRFVHRHMPKQTMDAVAKAVGSSLETSGNIPSLGRGTRGWSPLLRRIANTAFDI